MKTNGLIGANKPAALILFLLCSFIFCSALEAYEVQDLIKTGIVGEAFEKKVSRDEFLYHYKTASIFSRTDNDKKERNSEDVRQEAWQNLIFIKEAKSLGIKVERNELEADLKRLLKEKGIEYGSQEYLSWVPQNFGEGVKTFEQRIEGLLLINKLVAMKMNPQVSVTEEEMKEKFLNQYNSFESEYIKFDTQEQAEEFIAAVKKNPLLWKETFDKKKAESGQKGAAWINIMSLEALIDLWKIPREDAYRILEHQEGDLIIAKNYYGDAVFRLLYKRRADLKEYDKKKQDYYRKMLSQGRKRKLAKDYFEGLFKRANFHDYVAEKEEKEKIAAMEKKTVVLETNQGNIELKLFPETAPLACENFIGLAQKGYYNGVIFHRVIKDFMIQGGDPSGTGAGGESFWGNRPFADEINKQIKFDRPGILAMANSGTNTNKSQFFITLKPTPWLDGKHTIFGEVISGMDAVKAIDSQPTDDKDRPEKEQKIIKAYIKQG